MDEQTHCKKCGATIESPKCTEYGTIQDTFNYKSRIAAASLAIFAGLFGAHRFFLGQWWGIFYLLFFWTYIPWIIGMIEGIVFLCTNQEEWNRKYNQGISVGQEKGTVVAIFAILMPLIFIVGILAAVAIPAYQDYTTRAKVTEGVAAASMAKVVVSEYIITNEEFPIDNAAARIDENKSSKYVETLMIENGVIYVQMTPDTGVDGLLIFTPSYSDGDVTWSCTDSTIESKFLPSVCR